MENSPTMFPLNNLWIASCFQNSLRVRNKKIEDDYKKKKIAMVETGSDQR